MKVAEARQLIALARDIAVKTNGLHHLQIVAERKHVAAASRLFGTSLPIVSIDEMTTLQAHAGETPVQTHARLVYGTSNATYLSEKSPAQSDPFFAIVSVDGELKAGLVTLVSALTPDAIAVELTAAAERLVRRQA
jgi:hypothetical protein